MCDGPGFTDTSKGGYNDPGRCPMGKRQRFSKVFKLEAVRLMGQSGRPAVDPCWTDSARPCRPTTTLVLYIHLQYKRWRGRR